MKIAFLGLGKMGFPMARRLLNAGHQLTVWNRTAERAEPLTAAGASLAATPGDAVRNAEAVCTTLFDDAAHESVLFGPQGVLDALPSGAVHIVLSTISPDFSSRLAVEHARRNRPFVAAPVFGRPNVAEEGRLWIVVAGQDAAIALARPVLEVLSRGITVVGSEPRQAHALKLGGNFLISAMIHSLGEAFVYAAAQGIEPEIFLETINSALFQSPFYAAYGKVMLNPPTTPGATMELGAKDLDLFREAATERQVSLSLAEEMAEIFSSAKDAGMAGEDWAVGQYRMAQQRSARTSSDAVKPASATIV
jgi:3-hydroxyisobutyrate dehydrogenase-like beta-hydroxyacid dehydrogenase